MVLGASNCVLQSNNIFIIMTIKKKRVRFQTSPPTVYIEPDEIATDPTHRSKIWKRNTELALQ